MIEIDDDTKDYSKKVYRALPVLQRLVNKTLEEGLKSSAELESLDWIMDEIWSYFDHTYIYGEQWSKVDEQAGNHK